MASGKRGRLASSPLAVRKSEFGPFCGGFDIHHVIGPVARGRMCGGGKEGFVLAGGISIGDSQRLIYLRVETSQLS